MNAVFLAFANTIPESDVRARALVSLRNESPVLLTMTHEQNVMFVRCFAASSCVHQPHRLFRVINLSIKNQRRGNGRRIIYPAMSDFCSRRGESPRIAKQKDLSFFIGRGRPSPHRGFRGFDHAQGRTEGGGESLVKKSQPTSRRCDKCFSKCFRAHGRHLTI